MGLRKRSWSAGESWVPQSAHGAEDHNGHGGRDRNNVGVGRYAELLENEMVAQELLARVVVEELVLSSDLEGEKVTHAVNNNFREVEQAMSNNEQGGDAEQPGLHCYEL